MSENATESINELKLSLEMEQIRRMEAELRLHDQELAMQQKDDLLASMSHELRTPLTAVIGISEGLQEEVYGPVNELQMKSLKSIEDGGRDLLSLLSDIVDLAKIETDRLQVDIQPVDVHFVCRSSLRFIKETAQKKRLHLAAPETYPDQPILADQRCLKQIIVNLLKTAVKFTPEGGEMGLEVEADPENRAIRIIVWDSGAGEDLQSESELMKSLLSRDSRESSESAGIGWSLSLVKQLVALHEGKVEIQSQPSRGNRFIVTLPAGEARPKDAPTP